MDVSRPYANGKEAARAHVVHMIAYAYTPPIAGHVADIVRAYGGLDPRYAAVAAAGWGGIAKTIADLSGRWASISDYDERICARSLAMWPNTPDVPAEEDKPVTKPTILVVSGHRSYGDTGNAEEKALTPAMSTAYETALEAAGYSVTHLQREGDGDNDPDDTVGGLDTVGQKCAAWMAKTPGMLVMIDCHYEGSAAPGCFAIVPDKRHLGTAINVPQPANDNWESNTLDVSLARAIAKGISDATGLQLRTSGVREPGVMSETQTGVAGAYNARLAMFAYTAPYRDRAVRLVVEHGNHILASDRAEIFTPDFTEKCAAAAVAAIEAVFGQVKAPAPIPDEPDEPVPTKPEPAIGFPPGIDNGLAEWLFGRIDRGGKVYSFNAKGAISKAWLKFGARYGYTAIVDVWRFDDGREYIKFGSFTLWRAKGEAWAPLESGEAA
jgi:hypothetical protein